MSDVSEFPFDLNLPLNHEEEVTFDLNTSYNHLEVCDGEEDTANADIDPPNSDAFDLNVPYNHEEVYGGEEVAANVNMNLPNSGIAQQVISENRKVNLSNDQRWAIYNALLARSFDGKLKRHTTKEVSEQFGVSIRAVQRIWKRSKDTLSGQNVDVSHRRVKNCGRKRIEIDINQITSIPLHRRTTLRSLAAALGVGLTTVHKRLKGGLLRRHSNAIKPLLREENKRARVQFCLDMLDPSSIPQEPKFVGMYNVVHIDEKWFYMTKKNATYYLHSSEEEPLRTCQSKNYIKKVMFLVAMARSRFDEDGNEVFSGKIGLFPMGVQQTTGRE